MTTDNPLLAPVSGNAGLPPFSAIRAERFQPAFEAQMTAHRAAVAAITASPEPATFENTIVPLERAGLGFGRIEMVFSHLASADANGALQAVERALAPVLSGHWDAILLDAALFGRIEAVWRRRGALGAEEARVAERYHTDFVRAGAGLDSAGKARLAAINGRLAALGAQFGQNVLADESGWMLVLDGRDDLAGLPASVVAAAAAAATERKLTGSHVITLGRSSIEPFLQFSSRRDLREKAFEAWCRRGAFGGATDNRGIIAETIALRNERAKLLGYRSYAHFSLADTMARTPEAVAGLLHAVWEPAKRRLAGEQALLQAQVVAEGGNYALAPHDWRYFAEKVRKAEFDFDEAELKPYLSLEAMIAAAFDTASRLFGLRFEALDGLDLYHPDVRVWRVTRGGREAGIFLGDYFARPSKRSGAWMTGLRTQHKLDGDVRPIVVNVMNFAKAPAGQPTLLSFDDARTLFHEFGHALHGLLSDVTYPLISGTNVARDFVELPSQLFEHWLEEPQVLRRFAVHADTGAPMPEALLAKVLAARRFNQGFATIEYTASALVDLDLHLVDAAEGFDVVAHEKAVLAREGMPEVVVMRHSSPHFHHIFAGGYAAGYYSYLWSEVLDADAFESFEDAGDPFDPQTAGRLHEYIYAAGYRRAPADAYMAFRGRLPSSDALLRKRGLDS